MTKYSFIYRDDIWVLIVGIIFLDKDIYTTKFSVYFSYNVRIYIYFFTEVDLGNELYKKYIYILKYKFAVVIYESNE